MTTQLKNEIENAKFLMNELVYLVPSLPVEKSQGREFTSKLSASMERLEMLDNKGECDSFISLVSVRITISLNKFK